MAKVAIVSRTKMKNGVCCGGFNTNTGEFIRLHTKTGGKLPTDAPYQVGELYDLVYKTAWNSRPKPHVEDKQILSARYLHTLSEQELEKAITEKCIVFEGDLSCVFDGLLKCEKYAMYIDQSAVPNYSVCFWRPNKPLFFSPFMSDKYQFGDNNIKFVGFQTPVKVIPAGTLIRLSLANWWAREEGLEKKCYLQLSGWYNLNER